MVEFRCKLNGSKSRALNNKTFKKLWWLYAILAVFIIACGILGIVKREDNSDFFAGVFLIVLGVLITPLGYLFTMFLQKRNDKATIYISDETEEVYTFDEQYITITQTRSDIFSATLKAKYSYIYKAVEDKNYYYLFVSKLQSHVIDKSSITQGSLQEMSALLKSNLGEKFKNK